VANRRQVLKWAAAASVAASGALTMRLSSAASREASSDVELFVFDRRFAAARSAAARHAARNVEAAGFDGDLTQLWYERLDLDWKRAPMTLAGVTTARGLFVLETLAADRGMRVVQREELPAGHSADEPLYTWLIAPRART
jgi:hypothetical protein